jgi:hypothetical protein
MLAVAVLRKPGGSMWSASGSVDIRFSRFYFREPHVRPIRGNQVPSGILTASPGLVMCTTGTLLSQVRFEVEIVMSCPGIRIDEYEDIVEMSYVSTCGRLSVADWAGYEVQRLPWIPAGPGAYRLRYHARDMDSPGVGHCLVQIWPAVPQVAAALKISSETGHFWHPLE